MIIYLVWSTLITAEVIGSVIGVRVHILLHGKTIIVCAFVITHVLVGCLHLRDACSGRALLRAVLARDSVLTLGASV
jgi:hypothetical protein